jgi:hypothetical protein
LCGCAIPDRPHYSTPRVSLPAAAAWYAGGRVYYITTEITDSSMARNGGITYAPRLTDAIPEYPKRLAIRGVLGADPRAFLKYRREIPGLQGD